MWHQSKKYLDPPSVCQIMLRARSSERSFHKSSSRFSEKRSILCATVKRALLFGPLNHVRPIQRFLKVRSGPLTFLEGPSGFLRCPGRVHAGVTSGISLGASRASGVLDFSARAGLLLRLLAALPLHSTILKPDLHLRRKAQLFDYLSRWFIVSHERERLAETNRLERL